MKILDKIRARLRRNRRWVTARRVQREGLGKEWKRWRLWSRILDTKPVITEPVRSGACIEVHLLCSYLDYLSGIWALKSFYHFGGVAYPLVVHIQGRVPARVVNRLREHFPAARLIQQDEADRIVQQYLSEHGFTRLAAARRNSPFMLKLTDFAIFSEAQHLIMLDSDVLFFARPSELLINPESPVSRSLFQRDAKSTYNIAEDEAQAEFGIHMASAVNTGIALLPRRNLDLGRCERYLAHPDVARPTGWIEQTLHSLCASEQGAVDFLPDSYLVSLAPSGKVHGLVARHYAGLSRPLLTAEGMPCLLGMWRGNGHAA